MFHYSFKKNFEFTVCVYFWTHILYQIKGLLEKIPPNNATVV